MGASHIGQGGFCGTNSVPDHLYGSFYMKPSTSNIMNLLGSTGVAGNKLT